MKMRRKHFLGNFLEPVLGCFADGCDWGESLDITTAFLFDAICRVLAYFLYK
jgi:hypothetical protein